MWFEKYDGFYILKIKVVPNSSINKIMGLLENHSLKIKLKSPPVDGAANKELIKYLSKLTHIPKSELTILTGKTAQLKRIKIPLNKQSFEEFYSLFIGQN